MIPLLLSMLLLAPAPNPDLKRARDRYEFGAWADAAGAARELLARRPEISEAEAVEAWRILGLSEYQLGDLRQAREAFVNMLSLDPDQVLDPFLVPPAIVEFFDRAKQENEEHLRPLRERKHQLREQERLAEDARRRLLAEEQARTGPPTRVVRVQDRIYLFNWMPFGAGQFQNGDNAKGTIIATAQVVIGLANIAAILVHNQIADDRSRRCSLQDTTNCSRPPISDSDRRLLGRIDTVKYATAGLFWAVYAYGVVDAHLRYVPRVETEISPGEGAGVKLSWRF